MICCGLTEDGISKKIRVETRFCSGSQQQFVTLALDLYDDNIVAELLTQPPLAEQVACGQPLLRQSNKNLRGPKVLRLGRGDVVAAASKNT